MLFQGMRKVLNCRGTVCAPINLPSIKDPDLVAQVHKSELSALPFLATLLCKMEPEPAVPPRAFCSGR